MNSPRHTQKFYSTSMLILARGRSFRRRIPMSTRRYADFSLSCNLGILAAFHRDAMGSSFAPRELHVTYGPIGDARMNLEVFGCPVFLGGQKTSSYTTPHGWTPRPRLGSEITHSSMVHFRDQLLEEFQLRVGLLGKVRGILLVDLARPTSFNAVPRLLKMTPRTLRRKLQEENSSHRALADELGMQVAIKYLHCTSWTVEDIAFSLGFSDAANFRHAFRRWPAARPTNSETFPGRTRKLISKTFRSRGRRRTPNENHWREPRVEVRRAPTRLQSWHDQTAPLVCPIQPLTTHVNEPF
jgi:AraC-like DNA-binding protein